MVIRRLIAVVTAGLVALVGAPVTTAGAEPGPVLPESITAFTAGPGPRPGEITFRWTTGGADTSRFLLETALTPFGGPNPALPLQGRNPKAYEVSLATARAATLTAAQVAQSGAGLGTGRQLYLRLSAVRDDPAGLQTATFPLLRGAMPRGLDAAASGTKVRAGTFNVRTAKATYDARPWPKRAMAVAKEIVSHKMDVVALQELSPGRADGKPKSTKGVLRQTTSLLAALKKSGGSRYKLVRTTSYVKAGSPSGSQGARILYDADRFRRRGSCPEKTRKKTYNASCTIKMPLLATDKESLRRRAAYTLLQDRRTNRKFYVVSAHLDQRHSTNPATEAALNKLRGDQARAVISAMAKINSRGRAVVFGADLNSWQTNKTGDAPRDVLVGQGWFDTANAKTAVNLGYDSSNRFVVQMKPNPYGYGTRIDAVLVSRSKGARYFENVLTPSSTARPSDHNLLLADLVL